MSISSKYKLVPYNGNVPCNNCPLSNNCDDYFYRLLVDGDITSHDDIFKNCLNINEGNNRVIPQLIDNGEDTSKDSDL